MMLSAQPITLTGEQHDRLWNQAKAVRELSRAQFGLREGLAHFLDGTSLLALERSAQVMAKAAENIERILIDAQGAAPPAVTAGDAA